MMRVLDMVNQFYLLSGQQVSIDKISILFSINTYVFVRRKLDDMSGFNETQSLGKYLGAPLLGRAPRISDFNYILEQVKSKLAS